MIIIGNGKLITLSSTPLDSAADGIATEGDFIIDVGKTESLLADNPDSEFIDVNGAYIAPGFVDLHAHSRNVILLGAAIPRFASNERFRLFRDFLRPIEAAMMHDDAAALAYAYALRAIKNGVTSIFEHHSFPHHPSGSLHTVSSVFRECGLRACIGYEVSDRFGAWKATAAVKENAEFIEYCANLGISTVKSQFGLGSSLELDDAMLEACRNANTLNAPIHVHVGETQDGHLFCIRKYGKSPAQRLIDSGVVTPDSVFVCGAFTDKSDLELIVENAYKAVISPSMVSLLGSAYHYAFESAAADCQLLLGTDGLCGSMLEAGRTASHLFALSGKPTSNCFLPAASMLFRANPEAASSVFGRKLGVLETGAAADIIALKTDLAPRFNSEEALLTSLISTGAECTLTMVNGRVLMRNGELCDLDEGRISAGLSASIARLIPDTKYSCW